MYRHHFSNTPIQHALLKTSSEAQSLLYTWSRVFCVNVWIYYHLADKGCPDIDDLMELLQTSKTSLA